MISAGYSVMILTYLLLLYVIMDYMKFSAKMKRLKEIYVHLSTDKQLLPKPGDQLEWKYQEMISSLYEIIQCHVETIEKAHLEQVEYYTMWVHQIKTPISAMRLALHSGAPSPKSELLEQELFKVEQYVELALQYTKMKDLSTDLVIRDYSLEEIVNQSVKKYAGLFIYKKLSVQIQEIHAIVTTDSKWLSFILEQLLSNAIKYTNQGVIEIAYENNTLTIRDTGIGIRKEDMERIFEKGYTGYNGRVDKKASGIGLYLTKKAADSLAIKISITSEVGKGTTAAVTFPENDHN
jgi:signal transduction histidine kinase